MNKPRVTIIIPNYNNEHIVGKLIESLINQTYTNYELIIVDNNSSDKSLEVIRKRLEENAHKLKYGYRIIKLRKNYGYCIASNIGALYSNATDYLVIINNDLILDRNWLKELVEYMDKNPHIGIASSKVVYHPLNKVDSTGLIVDRYGAVISRGFLQNPETVDTRIINQTISSAHGASIIVRKELFKAIGGYDNLLSMYYDDVDVSWRIMLLGYKVGYANNSICYHVKTPEYSIRLSVWKYYLSNRNRLRVMIKNYEFKNLIRYVPLATLLIILRGILQALLTLNPLYMYYSLKILLWNITHLKNTLKQRKIVQAYRRVNDEVVLKSFVNYSIELGYLKILLRIKR